MASAPVVILHTDAPDAAVAVLRDIHPDLPVSVCDSYAALPDLVAQTEAEIIYTVRFAGALGFPRETMVLSPTVKWVAVGGSGTDHLRPWDPAKVTVTNSAGVAADMMAEYVLGAILSFSLGLRDFERRQRAREWSPGKVEPIEGRTLLVLGMGKTGQAVARRAKAMGMATIGVRARPAPTPDFDAVYSASELTRILPRADYILCCVPLLDSTRGLIDAEAFAAMKPSAVLVDVSRGGVVDQTALIAALDRSAIKGAALDVFATEPLPADNPLWGYENVIVTPHCSSVYDGWDAKSVRMFAENLARYRRGEPLSNVVDPIRGY